MLYKIQKSPTLRKIYGNIFKDAAKENAASFNKNVKELDKRFKQSENEENWEFVD
jgi:hypothetical protein